MIKRRSILIDDGFGGTWNVGEEVLGPKAAGAELVETKAVGSEVVSSNVAGAKLVGSEVMLEIVIGTKGVDAGVIGSENRLKYSAPVLHHPLRSSDKIAPSQ